MSRTIRQFLCREDGNAVIDWLVLTAGLVVLGLSVGVAVSTPAQGVATDINTAMESVEPATP